MHGVFWRNRARLALTLLSADSIVRSSFVRFFSFWIVHFLFPLEYNVCSYVWLTHVLTMYHVCMYVYVCAHVWILIVEMFTWNHWPLLGRCCSCSVHGMQIESNEQISEWNFIRLVCYWLRRLYEFSYTYY